MTAIQILMAKVLGGIILVCLATLGWNHYISKVEQRGYDRAVAEGKIALQQEKDLALAVERDLRKQLANEQRLNFEKETRHAQELADAQRRVRAGTDRLLCPTVRKVPGTSTDPGGPAAGGPAPDEEGDRIVPEVAAEILGDGATIAGIVRKFQRLEKYYAVCKAVANGEAPPPLPDLEVQPSGGHHGHETEDTREAGEEAGAGP